MSFVGRERELKQLDRRLDNVRRKGLGQLIAVRGRRRVGKSRLIQEFAARAECPCVFFTAVQDHAEDELSRFAEAILESSLPSSETIRSGAVLTRWEGALELAVQGATKEQPVILVIDELPYLAEKVTNIEAVIQKVWDHVFQNLPVLVIVIGSDEAMMEALTERGRPLFDRAREMVVNPLTPADICDLLKISPADALDAYTIIGGFPVLALEWGSGVTLEDYLAETLSDPTSFLIISAERTLAAEFPPEAHARTVLSAIGHDVRSYSKISALAGLSGGALERALEILQTKRLVERLLPYSTRRDTRNSQYYITDSYMRFWLRFVNNRIDRIERGLGRLVVDEFKRGWPTFCGRAIEPIVKRSVEQMLPDPERFGTADFVGSFWNRSNTIEVDLVGGDRLPVARNIGFIGSIKWGRGESFSAKDAQALARQRSDIPGAEAAQLVGISNKAFTDGETLDARLTPEDLVNAWRRES